MNVGNHQLRLNRLRSYSTLFSSTSFKRLIEYGDYDFLNYRVARYDEEYLGVKFRTYSEYLTYTYKELQRSYRNEYFYKNTLINHFLIKEYCLQDSVIQNEFKVGKSIADLVIFNGTSKAFEIKTELDSDTRLETQLNDYKRVFKHCYLVINENQLQKYLDVEKKVGIILLVKKPRSVKIEMVREATEISEEELDPSYLIRCLRNPEYKAIVKDYYGELPEMNSFNMFKICEELMSKIPLKDLHDLFLFRMKQRKSNTPAIKLFPKELRQLALALKLNVNQYFDLEEKLSRSINI